MFDWHSEYLVIQARQREMAAAAGPARQLAEARIFAGAGGGRRRSSAPWQARGGSLRPRRARRGPSLRQRLGAALVLLGRRLEGSASRLPSASGN